jgi:hypothetical protein
MSAIPENQCFFRHSGQGRARSEAFQRYTVFKYFFRRSDGTMLLLCAPPGCAEPKPQVTRLQCSSVIPAKAGIRYSKGSGLRLPTMDVKLRFFIVSASWFGRNPWHVILRERLAANQSEIDKS